VNEWTEEKIDESVDGQSYCYYTRQVGQWRLEVFPPEEGTTTWTGVCELGGKDLEVGADTLPEAQDRIEQALATVFVSVLMNLVGHRLPDEAWEQAIAFGESL